MTTTIDVLESKYLDMDKRLVRIEDKLDVFLEKVETKYITKEEQKVIDINIQKTIDSLGKDINGLNSKIWRLVWALITLLGWVIAWFVSVMKL